MTYRRVVRTALRWTYGLSLLSAACGSAGSDDVSPPRSMLSPPVTSAPDHRPRLVVLGDSLTAGLGLDVKDAYPTLLQQKLHAAGIDLRVVNAGISGDTSAGGLSRVDLALEGDVRLMLLALGGNDALRALPVEELRRNLSTIIERAQARGVTVILAGMEAPPNFGQDYTAAFREAVHVTGGAVQGAVRPVPPSRCRRRGPIESA